MPNSNKAGVLLPNPEFELAMAPRRGDVEFLNEVFHELTLARGSNAPMNSAHEAFAVILEELEEFKLEVFKKRALRDRRAMYTELIQVAAMAARAAVDLELPRG